MCYVIMMLFLSYLIDTICGENISIESLRATRYLRRGGPQRPVRTSRGLPDQCDSNVSLF